jgi:hypothetical protein
MGHDRRDAGDHIILTAILKTTNTRSTIIKNIVCALMLMLLLVTRLTMASTDADAATRTTYHKTN